MKPLAFRALAKGHWPLGMSVPPFFANILLFDFGLMFLTMMWVAYVFELKLLHV